MSAYSAARISRRPVPPVASERDASDNVNRESARETFLSALETLETAPLPAASSYRITAAVSGDVDTPSPACLQRYRLQGEEALSDAFRPGRICHQAPEKGRTDAYDGGAGSHGACSIRPDEGVVWSTWVGEGAKRRRLVDHQGVPMPHPSHPGASAGDGGSIENLDYREETAVRKAPLWYSVPLRYPCSCQLMRYRYRYTPADRPPLSHALPTLARPFDAEQWPVGDTAQLPEWDAQAEGSDAIEEGIPSFELLWRNAGVKDRRKRLSLGPGDAGIEKGTSPVVGSAPALQQRHTRSALLSTNKDAQVHVQSARSDSKTGRLIQMRDGLPGYREGNEPVEAVLRHAMTKHPESRGAERGVEEVKRRKKLWRHMIASDEGYGQMWDIIPLPHVRSAKYASAGNLPLKTPYQQRRNPRGEDGEDKANDPPHVPPRRTDSGSTIPPPPFILPRALTQLPCPSSHPFHPDLSRYMTKYGASRVYWIIPINGPVIVQTVNDHDLPGASPNNAPTSDNDSTRHPLCPSTAILRDPDDLPHVDPLTRPFPLLWTGATLRQFWSKLCGLQDGTINHERDKGKEKQGIQGQPGRGEKADGRMFGGISVVSSGPKPDPFIDLSGQEAGIARADPGASGAASGGKRLKRHRGVKSASHLATRSNVNVYGVQMPDLARTADEAARSTNLPPPQHSVRPQPVEPECGDHIRIYLDARYALSFRSWLHAIQLDPVTDTLFAGRDLADASVTPDTMRALERVPAGAGVGAIPAWDASAALTDTGANAGSARGRGRRNLEPMSSTVQPEHLHLGGGGDEDGRQGDGQRAAIEGDQEVAAARKVKVRQFNKVRLALVGDRGEVLVVA